MEALSLRAAGLRWLQGVRKGETRGASESGRGSAACACIDNCSASQSAPFLSEVMSAPAPRSLSSFLMFVLGGCGFYLTGFVCRSLMPAASCARLAVEQVDR